MNLKKIIKEELDDEWSWTQSEPNMWLSYQMLIFDEVPTKKEIIKFINYAFKSGLVKNEAIRTWELEGIADEAQNIYEYAQEGSPYLRIDLNNGWLYYGSDYKDIVDKHPELRKIYFSEAKKYSINESDFDWINEIEPELTICDAINYLSVGDTIRVLNIEDWKNSNIIHDSLIAEVLEIDNCNDIMGDNTSKDLTILIHFKEEYGGFTSSWYNTLNSETNKEICSDGRCMFLICGEDGKGQEGVRVTPLSKDYINESEEDEWGWAKETNIDIPKNKSELEYFIGWSFLWDESGKKTGMWGYNGRLWEITGIDNNLVYYYDTKDKTTSDTDIRSFLRNLNDGSWVLVSPEGDILDPKYNRTYNKKINESNDDWTWVEETNINLPKTEEDLKDFIGWSFVWDTDMENHTGMWGYNGKEWKITQLELGEVWFKDQNSGVYHVENVNRFLTRIGEGSWVLVSPEGYLLDPQYNRTYNKKINESDNDFQWIEDVDPKDMTFRVGDVIKVHNVGDEDSFLNWLGDFSDDFLDNRFGEFIIGKIINITDKRIEIQERYTDEYIYFPNYLDMENTRTGGDLGWSAYPNLDMYYEILESEN